MTSMSKGMLVLVVAGLLLQGTVAFAGTSLAKTDRVSLVMSGTDGIPYPPPDADDDPTGGDHGSSGGDSGGGDSGSDSNPNPDNPYDPDNQPMPN